MRGPHTAHAWEGRGRARGSFHLDSTVVRQQRSGGGDKVVQQLRVEVVHALPTTVGEQKRHTPAETPALPPLTPPFIARWPAFPTGRLRHHV